MHRADEALADHRLHCIGHWSRSAPIVVEQHSVMSYQSQEAFAAACGMDRSYIGQVERGEKNVTLRTILAIAKAAEIDPGVLVTGLRG